ncbi:5-demethoxyubiquinol-8 5-hydroxylase UbiM [Acetobacteraceae bacterium]|nr:5-demethoxyubiquinol-8 5-hydroxylase UbiM [Acetobacteraceae bacterium]
MENSHAQSFDILIGGGGPAGLATALSFARDGWRVAVVEKAPQTVLAAPSFDGREIALTHHSRRWLENAGVWEKFPQECICPMYQARVESGDGGSSPLIFEAPHSLFKRKSSPKTGEGKALGWLIANHLIRKALYERVKEEADNITLLCGHSIVKTRQIQGGKAVAAELDNGEKIAARLLVAADGRFSHLRQSAGIGIILHDFKSNVLVCRVAHYVPHENVALQWFTEGRTVALLPVAEMTEDGRYQSSLVLTMSPEKITHLQQCDAAEFNKEISILTEDRYGPLTLSSPRIAYPLKAVYAHRFYADRMALVGDAAVGMHPITAHGFNFGLKAQEILAQEMLQTKDADPGNAQALRKYCHKLRMATFPLFAATNAIGTVYTRDETPFLIARKAALKVANRLVPFKNRIARALMDA